MAVPRRGKIALVLALAWGATLGGGLAAVFTRGELLESVATASTQSCDTDCQSRMTDCILSCDGVLPCEQECKKRAVGCVDQCRLPTATGASPDGGLDASGPAMASRDASRDAAKDARDGGASRAGGAPRDAA